MHAAHDCARDILCAQVFGALFSAAHSREWEFHLSELAGILRGGSVVRCDRWEKWEWRERVRGRISAMLESSSELPSLLLEKSFCEEVEKKQKAWRRVVSLGVAAGIAMPASLAAVAYLDSYRSGRLPGSVVQSMRDALEDDGFERLDKERGELFHCKWSK